MWIFLFSKYICALGVGFSRVQETTWLTCQSPGISNLLAASLVPIPRRQCPGVSRKKALAKPLSESQWASTACPSCLRPGTLLELSQASLLWTYREWASAAGTRRRLCQEPCGAETCACEATTETNCAAYRATNFFLMNLASFTFKACNADRQKPM